MAGAAMVNACINLAETDRCMGDRSKSTADRQRTAIGDSKGCEEPDTSYGTCTVAYWCDNTFCVCVCD